MRSIVTFLIQPPSDNAIFLLIALYFYYMIGNALEQTWGSFRFNLYFFTGVLFHVIAAFLIYLFTGEVYLLGTTYLNLFFVFCFCSGLSGYGVPFVLSYSGEGKVAGMV